jgi:REP element-mobilizing transposase RayT
MARPLRIQAAGLTYHVTARGVRRMNIYLDNDDRRRFLTLLAAVVQRYALQCHAYCEMTNHYHIAVTTTEANLSRACQQLNGDYAQWWNWRHKHVGHVFQGRFDAQIVQDDAYLLNVCRYIVLNPVRAGMVSTPEQWTWSSYAAMTGLVRRPSLLDCDRVLELVSPGDPADGPNRFRQSVLEADAHAVLPRDAILGDDAFVARFQPCRAQASREVPRREGRRTLEAIFRGAVTRTGRNAAIVTASLERYPLAEIARFLQVHPSTVSKVVSPQRGVRS